MLMGRPGSIFVNIWHTSGYTIAWSTFDYVESCSGDVKSFLHLALYTSIILVTSNNTSKPNILRDNAFAEPAGMGHIGV